MMNICDKLSKIIQSFDPEYTMKYNKYHIGLSKDGRSNNFIIFKPKKKFVWIGIQLEESNDIQNQLNEAGFQLFKYKRDKYRIKLTQKDVENNVDLLTRLIKMSYEIHGR